METDTAGCAVHPEECGEIQRERAQPSEGLTKNLSVKQCVPSAKERACGLASEPHRTQMQLDTAACVVRLME